MERNQGKVKCVCACHEGRRTRDPAVVPRRSSPLEVRQYKIDAVMHAIGAAGLNCGVCAWKSTRLPAGGRKGTKG